MAITSSAKKAIRNSEKRAVFNARRSDAVRGVVKQIKKLVSEKKVKDAQALVSRAYKAIDKAAKMHTIHKNTAARRKAQVARLVKVR